MDTDTQAIRSGPDPCLITDLGHVPLGQLAGRAAEADSGVAAVVLRILEGMESPGTARVQVMSFNSAI